MGRPTPEQQHSILTHLAARRGVERPEEVAALHGVTVSRSTIWRWQQKWNGTPRSLQTKPRSGRPRVLSRAQVSRHVRAPILAANRAQRAVHYTTLLASVREKTRTKVSLQTLRRYGKETLGVKQKHTTKRTAAESTCTHGREGARALRVMLRADLLVQCLLATVTRSQRCDANCRRSAATTSSSSMRLHSV
jgi:transposase